MKHLIIITLLMLCALSLNAQDTTKSKIKYLSASGKVVDEKGNPILGATIRIEGTTNGAKAKQDGSFTIQRIVPQDSYTFKVSTIGCRDLKKVFKAKELENITFVLKERYKNDHVDEIIEYPIEHRFYNDDVGTIRRIFKGDIVK